MIHKNPAPFRNSRGREQTPPPFFAFAIFFHPRSHRLLSFYWTQLYYNLRLFSIILALDSGIHFAPDSA